MKKQTKPKIDWPKVWETFSTWHSQFPYCTPWEKQKAKIQSLVNAQLRK